MVLYPFDCENEEQSGLNVAKLQKEKFKESLDRKFNAGAKTRLKSTDRVSVEDRITSTIQIVERACGLSMPQKKVFGSVCHTYWWTDEIAELSQTALML